MSINRWKDKEDIYTHTYTDIHTHTHTHTMEYYHAIKNEISPLATTWMDLEDIMLSKISDRKNKYCIILLIWGI